MKISYDWLSDYVQWKEKDPAVIAETLTRGMGEVEHVEVQGALLDNCVVGKVTNLRRHPNADKLSLCDVETDKGLKKVVCGGTNLREGMLVAFAHVGATVKWHGEGMMTLAPAKIRGEERESMVCAGEELDLATMFPPKKEDGERPIVDLSSVNAKVGTPLRDALGMHDAVFHIDNHAITNRPDLFSHIGVARECVALGLATWKKEPAFKAPKFPAASSSVNVKVTTGSLVPFYRACTLSIDGAAQTPLWMKKRLEATGWRSINLSIDITNYVLMECGMPLHSFDADDIKKNPVIRAAKKGESIVTLDKKELTLPEGALVMSDSEGIFDLVGIMGGLRSSTKDTTKNVYLHSAIVNGTNIRKTVIATGHRTEAATVYEKQVPFIAAEYGFYRALELFITLSGAKITSRMEKSAALPKAKNVTVATEKIKRAIGTEIAAAETKRILTNLGCTVKATAKSMTITPPLWRHDLREESDIVEDVARIHGYGKIPPVMPAASITPPERDARIHLIRDALKEEGCTELLHLAFTSPQVIDACGEDSKRAVRLINPLGEELSCMRPFLFPQILMTVSAQMKARNAMNVFEYGRIFPGADEVLSLCIVMSEKNTESVLPLKERLLFALRQAGYEGEIVQRGNKLSSAMHPGRTADILVQGKEIGMLFELHPLMAAKLDLPERTAVAEIDLDALFALPPAIRLAKKIPSFPAITYDETVALPLKKVSSVMIAEMKKKHALLESVETVDLFHGQNEKKLTLRFTYRSPEKTLTEQEAAQAHQSIVSVLTS